MEGGHETLAENLEVVRDGVAIFGTVSTGEGNHIRTAAEVGYPYGRARDYASFICGGDDYGDGDLTFYVHIDRGQIQERQPNFFMGVDPNSRAEVRNKWNSAIEAEIIMYGRDASCDDAGKYTARVLFPGWAEEQHSSVLFNGKPIPVEILPPGVGSNRFNFLADLHFADIVRVIGLLVFDIGHDSRNLEIHPVYSVDKITATDSNDLSGTWADDLGNTYYVRHNLDNNSVWYAALSPLGIATYGQVFRGILKRGSGRNFATVAGISRRFINAVEVQPTTTTVTGEIIALSLGFGPSQPTGPSGSWIGETRSVALKLGRTRLLGKDVPTLSADNFRLIKLYDFGVQ